MDVSIVIRTKNEARHIGQTLEAIGEQDFTGTYEIIIVDSESTDNTRNIAGRYYVKLVEIPQKDFSYGRSLNLGIDQSCGKFIVNLSAHVFPANRFWLSRLISGFHNSQVAAVYGRQISDRNKNPVEAFQNERFFGDDDLTFSKSNTRKAGDIHFSNSNCSLRRHVWDQFRFDENVPYAEDTLWQRRVIGSGYSIVYKADAAAYHTHRLNPIRSYRNSRNCARALASMNEETRSFAKVLRDICLFSGLVPLSIARHVGYIWQGRCRKHLAIVPFSVFLILFGWLMGRIKYRLNKGPGQGE